MLEELNPFWFQMARMFGRTIAELHGWPAERGISEREWLAWQAFAEYEAAQREVGR